MEIRMNCDIFAYREEIFFGLTLKQILILLPGAMLSALIYMLLSGAGLSGTGGWAAIMISAPFVYFSVFRYQGMTGMETVMTLIRHIYLPKTYVLRKGSFAKEMREGTDADEK